jgi:hypothetical protein
MRLGQSESVKSASEHRIASDEFAFVLMMNCLRQFPSGINPLLIISP